MPIGQKLRLFTELLNEFHQITCENFVVAYPMKKKILNQPLPTTYELCGERKRKLHPSSPSTTSNRFDGPNHCWGRDGFLCRASTVRCPMHVICAGWMAENCKSLGRQSFRRLAWILHFCLPRVLRQRILPKHSKSNLDLLGFLDMELS